MLQKELQQAMGLVLGCGGHVDADEMTAIEKALDPMWRTLPKNSYGRIDRRFFRYLAHRYFMQTSSLLIRGFEPTRLLNSSSWGSAEILSLRVPAFVESVLQSRNADDHGFSLEDAKTMIAALKQLIFDSESTILESAFSKSGVTHETILTREGLHKVLEVYLISWLMSDDPEGLEMLLKDRSHLENSFPHWKELVAFAEGQIRALDFARQVDPKPMQTQSVMKQQYTFDDAHAVVGGITASFASFWESECRSMKEGLAEMDPKHTGRVPLKQFYGSALDTEWRFSESEQYLRELGALDETSPWGKQVIIPNYLQGSNNCIVSGQHYLVCCVNECEDLLGEIEASVQAPVASPDDILQIVGNMTSHSISLDDDEPPRLEGALTKQLDEIASAHSGQVPIHGRLFAQWLHYAFPRECPFPHKAGATNAATPMEFGQQFVASKSEMQKHAQQDTADAMSSDLGSVTEEDMHWMSQWDEEEELIGDYSATLKASRSGRLVLGFVLMIVVGAIAGKFGMTNTKTQMDRGLALPLSCKTHYV
eukprot:gnl/TRDRNA2_/TRDRNA2_179086_c0_seq1.p1 gnl/TRDRNA2_/TRDRNA2_179086_c0~~gnl/TRDRNA2_/TRDRNA2_179086_c0_seq1.p1  ORF type:complete len:606 (-),score=118.02 gnl/TRDRNA2_/TRDRNA2_179086_c0_seq1:210-1820(-)